MSKSLKVSLKRNNLEAQLGEDIDITADVNSVRDVIVGVAGAVGVENCFKLAGGAAAATALYVLTKSVAKHWPWVKATGLEQDVVKFSVPPAKETVFKKLIEKQMLQQRVSEDFEDLDAHLEGILGEDEYENHGAKVEEMLEGVRIGSITELGSTGQSESIVAAKVVLGRHYAKEYGVKSTVLCGGQDTGTGIVAGEYIGPNAHAGGENHGGRVLVTRGYDGENAANIARIVQGDGVRVKIMGDTMRRAFQEEFDTRTTVREVVNELKSREGISAAARVTITRGNERLPPESTLAELESNGSTMNWQLVVED